MVTPGRQLLFEKFQKTTGQERVTLAKEFTRQQLDFLMRQLDDPEVTIEAIALALRDIAALVGAPPGSEIIFAGAMPPRRENAPHDPRSRVC